jgi:hypothetical protein
MEGAAPVGAILFPRIDAGAVGVEIEPLDPQRAGSSLMQNLLVPSSPARYSELFAPHAVGQVIPSDRQSDACRRLAEQVSAFACRLGPDSFAADLCERLRPMLGSREKSGGGLPLSGSGSHA